MTSIRLIASKLTYANVVASFALFIALGGVSYAAVKLPKNSVGNAQIKNGAVTSKKISKKTLSSLAGDQGPAGEDGRDGANGKDGASDVWVDDGVNVQMPTDTSTDIASVTVPAGNYVIAANEGISAGSGTTSGFSCSLTIGAESIQSQFATPSGTGTEAYTFNHSVARTFASTTTISVRCFAADGPAFGQVSLSALKVTNVH